MDQRCSWSPCGRRGRLLPARSSSMRASWLEIGHSRRWMPMPTIAEGADGHWFGSSLRRFGRVWFIEERLGGGVHGVVVQAGLPGRNSQPFADDHFRSRSCLAPELLCSEPPSAEGFLQLPVPSRPDEKIAQRYMDMADNIKCLRRSKRKRRPKKMKIFRRDFRAGFWRAIGTEVISAFAVSQGGIPIGVS